MGTRIAARWIRASFLAALVGLAVGGCAEPVEPVTVALDQNMTLHVSWGSSYPWAFAVYSDGTIEDVRGEADWSSSATSVVEVTATPSGGMLTPLSEGSAEISATYRGVRGSTRVTVLNP